MLDKILSEVLNVKILDIKQKVGRSKVTWVKFPGGSRFIKREVSRWCEKLAQEVQKYDWLSCNLVVSNEGRRYRVSQQECTCPDWKHNIRKSTTWRTRCKHQILQAIRKKETPAHTMESLLAIQTPKGVTLSKDIDREGYVFGIMVYFDYWKTNPYQPPEQKRICLGLMKPTPTDHPYFGWAGTLVVTRHRRDRSLGCQFTQFGDALSYLLKHNGLSLEDAHKPMWVPPKLEPTLEELEELLIGRCYGDEEWFASLFPKEAKLLKTMRLEQAALDLLNF